MVVKLRTVQRLIIMRGIPGSGKSTLAKQMVRDNTDYVRVSKDDLREMRGKYWFPKDEGMIDDMERAIIETALKHGKDVIVDATNLKESRIKWLTLIPQLLGIDVKVDMIRTVVTLDEAIRRDANRERSVGEEVVKRFYNKI